MIELKPGHRAANYELIEPLIKLCATGHLFEVQQWIAEGKPVNTPPIPSKGHRPRTPLNVAIDKGFQSLVRVLLEAGAVQEPTDRDSPMSRALKARRSDLVQLLVHHGFDPKGIDMHDVFNTWDPSIVELFIERGADVCSENHFAVALCRRIRTVVALFKRLRQTDPRIEEQGNIALRNHCYEGNLKWVSLMLWAGADPYQSGRACPENNGDPEMSAVGFAACTGNFEVFELKPIRETLPDSGTLDYLNYLTWGKGLDVLKKLLDRGLAPNGQSNGGCSIIKSCLEQLSWQRIWKNHWCARSDHARNLDCTKARDHIKTIYILAQNGARWIPESDDEINRARRSLLQMIPDYTIEFIWVMSKFKACDRTAVERLIRTSSIKSHIVGHGSRVQELIWLL